MNPALIVELSKSKELCKSKLKKIYKKFDKNLRDLYFDKKNP